MTDTAPSIPGPARWNAAIFVARETLPVLLASARAAQAAGMDRPCVVDVLVNGNRALAEAAAAAVRGWPPSAPGSALRVWFLPMGDKSATWNTYLHRIWQGGTVFFVDGYAEVNPDAFALLQQGMDAAPSALAASGVPTCGRTAQALRAAMLSTGGIHGNLYALQHDTLAALRAMGFALPLGLYRTDPLLGAVLAFGLDPAAHDWDLGRVVVHPTASWQLRQAPQGWLATLQGTLKRRLRQAQGELENRAARQHLALDKRAPALIATTARDFVGGWIAAHPAQARRLFWRSPLCWHAARKLRAARDWSAAGAAPQLLTGRADGADPAPALVQV